MLVVVAGMVWWLLASEIASAVSTAKPVRGCASKPGVSMSARASRKSDAGSCIDWPAPLLSYNACAADHQFQEGL
jgi:hypothetical protein